MSHNPERYKGVPELDVTGSILKIRQEIGELENGRAPSQSEVEVTVETLFPNLLENEKRKLVEAFLKSEEDAAAEADRRAE